MEGGVKTGITEIRGGGKGEPGVLPNPGFTLWKAVNENDSNKVKGLCDKYKNVDSVLNWTDDENGETPLHRAITNNSDNTAITRILVNTPGVDVNKQNNYGWTPLFFASSAGLPSVVTELLQHKDIDINISPTSGIYENQTPLQIATRYSDEEGYKEVVDILKKFKRGGKMKKTKRKKSTMKRRKSKTLRFPFRPSI